MHRNPARRFALAALLLAGSGLAAPALAQSSALGLGYLSPFGTPGLSAGPFSSAAAIAANGGTVVGWSVVPSTAGYAPVEKAFIWSGGAMSAVPFMFTAVAGDDFDNRARLLAVSADGGVATEFEADGGPGAKALVVTNGAVSHLPTLPGAAVDILAAPIRGVVTIGLGISAAGTTIVGSGNNADTTFQGFWWTASGGTQPLPFLPGQVGVQAMGQASAISADGSTIAGFSTDNTNGNIQATRWTGAGYATVTGLGFLPGGVGPGFSAATAVSGNGGLILGGSQVAGTIQGFAWTQAGGMVALPNLPGATSATLSGNAVPVGLFPVAVYAAGYFTGYPTSFAIRSLPLAVTPDGSIAVGTAADSTGTLQAVRWNGSGIATISGLLNAAGVATNGWVLNLASGIALVQNGQQQIVTGAGTFTDSTGSFTQAWLARLGCDAAGLPACGITTPSSLVNSLYAVAQMGELITWGNQRETLLAAERFGRSLGEGAPFTGFVTGRGAAWDPVARNGHYISGSAGLVGRVAPWLRLGLAVSHDYQQDEIARPTSRAIIHGSGGQVFALAGGMQSGPRLAATLTYEEMGARLRRAYANGSGTALGLGRAEGHTLGFAARAAWGFALDERTTLAPFAQLNWQSTRFGGYAESYANNPFPAVFNGQSYESLVLGAGVQAEHDFGFARGWGSAGYAFRTVGQGGATVSGQFVDLFSFSSRGIPVPERQFAEVSLGGSTRLTEQLELVTNLGVILPTDQRGTAWHAYGSVAAVMRF